MNQTNSTLIENHYVPEYVLHSICLFVLGVPFVVELVKWSTKRLLHFVINYFKQDRKQDKIRQFYAQQPNSNLINIDMELRDVHKEHESLQGDNQFEPVHTKHLLFNMINSKESIASASNIDSRIFKSLLSVKSDLDKLDYSLSDKQLTSFILNRLGKDVPTTSTTDIIDTLSTKPNSSMTNDDQIDGQSRSKNRKSNTTKASKYSENNSVCNKLLDNNSDDTKIVPGIKERVGSLFKAWLGKQKLHQNETDFERMERLMKNIHKQNGDSSPRSSNNSLNETK